MSRRAVIKINLGLRELEEPKPDIKEFMLQQQERGILSRNDDKFVNDSNKNSSNGNNINSVHNTIDLMKQLVTKGYRQLQTYIQNIHKQYQSYISTLQTKISNLQTKLLTTTSQMQLIRIRTKRIKQQQQQNNNIKQNIYQLQLLKMREQILRISIQLSKQKQYNNHTSTKQQGDYNIIISNSNKYIVNDNQHNKCQNITLTHKQLTLTHQLQLTININSKQLLFMGNNDHILIKEEQQQQCLYQQEEEQQPIMQLQRLLVGQQYEQEQQKCILSQDQSSHQQQLDYRRRNDVQVMPVTVLNYNKQKRTIRYNKHINNNNHNNKYININNSSNLPSMIDEQQLQHDYKLTKQQRYLMNQINVLRQIIQTEQLQSYQGQQLQSQSLYTNQLNIKSRQQVVIEKQANNIKSIGNNNKQLKQKQTNYTQKQKQTNNTQKKINKKDIKQIVGESEIDSKMTVRKNNYSNINSNNKTNSNRKSIQSNNTIQSTPNLIYKYQQQLIISHKRQQYLTNTLVKLKQQLNQLRTQLLTLIPCQYCTLKHQLVEVMLL